ncbi:hypothetical protein HZC31_01920 [Candidatus Woesearchaeota archaeon]|nr:hypothetical protein [Candidatus Woesearchaeota archaeon]
MAIPLSPSSNAPRSLDGSSPVIHRRRITDDQLEQLVLHEIQQHTDFTLFLPPCTPKYHGFYHDKHPHRQPRPEDEENYRVLRSRPEFSGKKFDISSSHPTVTVVSTGKPISEFVPYYVWHETSGIHFYNLTTGQTTTGRHATVDLNHFAHPHALARVHNDPKALIRQVDRAFGPASSKSDGRFLEIDPSLLKDFTLHYGHSALVQEGGIEYFEELILPITLRKIFSVDVVKDTSSSSVHIDRSPKPLESKYVVTIEYQGGVRTDNLAGNIVGAECSVLDVSSVKKDQNYAVQQQTHTRKLIRQWITGVSAGLVLLTGGILGYRSSDHWAIFHTQNILREGMVLGDPSYYRNQAEQEQAGASPERQSLVATVIADYLVLQDNDALARSYYSRAVSFNSHNYYARYGVLITDVISGIGCTKTVREEEVSYLFFTQKETIPYYTCGWKDENNRALQHTHADRLLADLRGAGTDASLEASIITARTLSASSLPIVNQNYGFVKRSVQYASQLKVVQKTFDGGGKQ